MSDQFVEDGEHICDRCGGVGHVPGKYNSYTRKCKRDKCPKCKGAGKLDWVERIFGKK